MEVNKLCISNQNILHQSVVKYLGNMEAGAHMRCSVTFMQTDFSECDVKTTQADCNSHTLV